jgi:hypothetical protein
VHGMVAWMVKTWWVGGRRLENGRIYVFLVFLCLKSLTKVFVMVLLGPPYEMYCGIQKI